MGVHHKKHKGQSGHGFGNLNTIVLISDFRMSNFDNFVLVKKSLNQMSSNVFYSVFPFLSQLDESSESRRIKLKEVMDFDHDKNDSNDDSTAHKCNQCEYTSSWAHNLRAHLKIHSGEKSNKCNQCDYASSQAGNLKTHVKIHSGEKSNKCNLCDYASSQAGHLRIHLKTHSGDKSNKCNQCNFASTWPSALNKHLKTHSGEKSYV